MAPHASHPSPGQRSSVRSTLLRTLTAAMIMISSLVLPVGIDGASAATTLVVTHPADTADGVCDTDCSLRDAVRVGNTLSGGPVVIVVPAGHYQLAPINEPSRVGGPLHVTRPMVLLGKGPSTTIIDASENGRVFITKEDLTLDGLTLTGGRAPGHDEIELRSGGGILHQGGTLALRNVVMHDNEAGRAPRPDQGPDPTGASGSIGGHGGAIYSSEAADKLIVADSEFFENRAGRGADGLTGRSGQDGAPGRDARVSIPPVRETAGGDGMPGGDGGWGGVGGAGGAIHSRAAFTVITDSSFRRNLAGSGGRGGNGGRGGDGGDGGFDLFRLVRAPGGDGGRAGAGGASGRPGDGGALHIRGALELRGSTLIGNHTGPPVQPGLAATPGDGGKGGIEGIDPQNGRPGSQTADGELQRGGDGGAIDLRGTDPIQIESSVFSVNHAMDDGGAIDGSAGEITIVNTTFSDNFAADRGGALRLVGVTNLRWSTIAGNTAGKGGGIFAGLDAEPDKVRLFATIMEDNVAERGQQCEGLMVSLGHNVFGPTPDCGLTLSPDDAASQDLTLAAFDGRVHPLREGHPAIDRVPINLCDNNTDLIGNPRPRGEACDAGSFEADPAALPVGGAGYWMLEANGRVHTFGGAEHHGDVTEQLPSGATAVDLDATPEGDGYLVLDSLGNVYALGMANYFGGIDDDELDAGELPIAISGLPTGDGYWVFTTRGRVASFGDAPDLGDVMDLALNGSIIAAVGTPSGEGHYMVGSDGGVFSHGDAAFHGSVPEVLPPGQLPAAPVIGLVPTATGRGYWLVGSDGGAFSFGDAPFRGSIPGVLPPGAELVEPINGMVRFGDGYLMVAADGGIFAFSDLPFMGSLASDPSRTSPVTAAEALS